MEHQQIKQWHIFLKPHIFPHPSMPKAKKSGKPQTCRHCPGHVLLMACEHLKKFQLTNDAVPLIPLLSSSGGPLDATQYKPSTPSPLVRSLLFKPVFVTLTCTWQSHTVLPSPVITELSTTTVTTTSLPRLAINPQLLEMPLDSSAREGGTDSESPSTDPGSTPSAICLRVSQKKPTYSEVEGAMRGNLLWGKF
jgi:hypothetical protein